MQTNQNDMIIAPREMKIIRVNNPFSGNEFTDYEEVGSDYTEEDPAFIESNTQAITFDDLCNKLIVPTFADNTLTIPMQNYINAAYKAAENVFGELSEPQIRVSHPISGRTPDAIGLKAAELREDQKTLFYQRLAWICRVKNITKEIDGKTIHLCIGGVRAYNEDRLYARKNPEKMRVFVSWTVKLCSNLMLQCQGNVGNFECMTEADIYQKSIQLFQSFNPVKEENFQALKRLTETRINESQFCTILGRMRLYNQLPIAEQNKLPKLIIGDTAAIATTRGYIENPDFGRKDDETTISLFDLMNLMNESVKQAYIDRWADRNQNCTDFCIGLQRALSGTDSSYDWFLQ